MPFRSTPDYATQGDAEQAWNDAWAMINRGEPELAIPVFERLYSTGRNGVAAALGFAWQKTEDWEKAEEFYRIAVFEHGDEDAKLGLCGILYMRPFFERVIANDADTVLARQLAREISDRHPYAHVLTGMFCHAMHWRLATAPLSEGDNPIASRVAQENWLDEAGEHYQRAAEAGLIVGMFQLAAVLWQQGRHAQSIGLRLKTAFRAFRLYARDYEHPGLFGVQEVYGRTVTKKEGSRDFASPIHLVNFQHRPSASTREEN